jgi:CBS domain-containing protein
MEDVFIGRLMSSPVRTVSRETTVRDAAEKMRTHGIGSVVAVDADHHLEGIITSTDFVRIVNDEADPAETTVDEYLTTEVVTAAANDSIRDIADLMLEEGIHHVPVVDDTEGVVGMLTTTDLAAYLSHVEAPSPDTDAAEA